MVFKKDDVRVVIWWRVLVFPLAAGLGFGCAFELLRWLADGVVSFRSLACETALIGVGAAVFLLSNGLLKPFERLFPLDEEEDIAEGTDGDGSVEIPGTEIDEE